MQDLSPIQLNYLTISNPYDAGLNRAIEQQPRQNIPNVVPDGGMVKDLWIDTFIRSSNWQPNSTGINIDAVTGAGEFQSIATRKQTITGAYGSGGGTGVIKFNYNNGMSYSNNTIYISAEGRINITPISSVSTPFSINGGGIDNAEMMLLQKTTGATAPIGFYLNMDSDVSSAAIVGIKMKLTGNQVPFAFSFQGSEGVAGAVGGSQDKKIRIKIGTTTYYIPCYTA